MDQLAQYLKSEHITAAAFAKRLNSPASTVTRLLSGERGCSLKMARRIEEATHGKLTAVDLWNERLKGGSI